MVVVMVDSEVWEPSPLYYLLIFASCFASIFFFPYLSGSVSAAVAAVSPFDRGISVSSLRFQRSFFLLCSLASVIHGLHSFNGDFKYASDGISREQTVLYLSAGAAAATFLGSFLGIVSDVIGPRKACYLFFALQLLVGCLKSMGWHQSIWLESVGLALAASIFQFCFETWMVIEHDKQGHRQDLLCETFWMVAFFEAASLIGSQGLSNFFVKVLGSEILCHSLAVLLAMLCIIYIAKTKKDLYHKSAFRAYRKSFSEDILGDKRVWLLAWAQASIHVSLYIFWILWAPTIVADGREVLLSRIFPCFLGSRMLGSTVFPWFSSGLSSPFNEECLITAFVVAGISLGIAAYDYQDIGVLVTLFCTFHACVGFILPSLARLRTMYVSNELRGGMMSLSLAPANAAFLFVLIQGGYRKKMENATIMGLAAAWLLMAAGCIYVLQWWWKHPRENSHSL